MHIHHNTIEYIIIIDYIYYLTQIIIKQVLFLEVYIDICMVSRAE